MFKDYYDKRGVFYGLYNGKTKIDHSNFIVFNLPKEEIIKIGLKLFSNHTLKKTDSFMLLN